MDHFKIASTQSSVGGWSLEACDLNGDSKIDLVSINNLELRV
jgi:hypothetical protein